MQFSTKELQLQKTTKELHSECWPRINVYFYILLDFANEKINTDALMLLILPLILNLFYLLDNLVRKYMSK